MKSIHVLDRRLELLQHEDGFKTSIDAVFLASSCQAKTGQHVLDLGCGIGSAGLCLAKRIEGIHLTGLDIQGDQIETARCNAYKNNLEAEFITGDVRSFDAPPFDHIICNPPYNDVGAHLRSPSAAKATAMGHDETSLQDWLDAGCKLLKHGGSLNMIHQAAKVDMIIKGLKNRFGAVEIIPLYPKAGKAANRVIIRAKRNSKAPASIHSGLILHEDDGSYTSAAEKILREMQPLL